MLLDGVAVLGESVDTTPFCENAIIQWATISGNCCFTANFSESVGKLNMLRVAHFIHVCFVVAS